MPVMVYSQQDDSYKYSPTSETKPEVNIGDDHSERAYRGGDTILLSP
jgi:hypothetical protein